MNNFDASTLIHNVGETTFCRTEYCYVKVLVFVFGSLQNRSNFVINCSE